MKRFLWILAFAFLAFHPMVASAQVDCSSIAQEEILHCDVPSDSSIRYIAGLSLQWGANYHCYRTPRIVLTRIDNTETVIPVAVSKWQYANSNQNVTTTFKDTIGTTFTMNSTAGFSPLSGSIVINGQTISFRTCGNQRTSAYYWTPSSQNPLEAFSCPVGGVPAGCPKVGYNP